MKQSRKDLTWVLIEIKGVVYAISCESVLSLSQLSKVTPLPRSPKELRGTVEFRTRLIQLYDTRALLGLETEYQDSNTEIMLVLGDAEYCIGISVDHVLSIENLYDIDEELLSDQVTNTEYISGIAKRKDGSCVLILNDEYIMDKYIPM